MSPISSMDKFYMLSVSVSEVLTAAVKSNTITKELGERLALSLNNRFAFYLDQNEALRRKMLAALDEVEDESKKQDTLYAEFGLAPEEDDVDDGTSDDDKWSTAMTHTGKKGGKVN
jgi:hypothetical protein